MYKFESAKNIIQGAAFYAFPHIFHSCRRGNDREVTNPKTRDKCLNNISEIGYLIKNLSESEVEELASFTVRDLESCYDYSYLKLSHYFRKEYGLLYEGRFGTRLRKHSGSFLRPGL